MEFDQTVNSIGTQFVIENYYGSDQVVATLRQAIAHVQSAPAGPEVAHLSSELQQIESSLASPQSIDKPTFLEKIESLNDYVATAKSTVAGLSTIAPYLAQLYSWVNQQI